ncbi:MAG: LPXTG cell wall anchor domain-containing protein [Desulfobacteraceae bacterium]|jgi:LPXTG-motif cell wall-anchored protein
MFSKKKITNDGIFKSIVFAHLVLSLHLILFAALALLVVFLSGMMQNMLWILLAGMILVAISAYLFYRRLRKEGKSLGEALRSPTFQGRAVEVSLLGGMATLKLDSPKAQKAVEAGRQRPPLQLEDSETARVRELNSLAQLLDKELITLDEFNSAKQRLLGP